MKGTGTGTLANNKNNIGGSWENELKVRGFSWTFGAEEEFLSPAWTTKRSLASSGIFSPPAWRGYYRLEAMRI